MCFLQGESAELASKPIENIIQRIDDVPKKWQRAIRNNGGGLVSSLSCVSLHEAGKNVALV